jgi:hypothetical protein
MIKCIRCGICCVSGTCSEGVDDDETGYCKFLTIHDDDTASCQLIVNNTYKTITLGQGCVLRESDLAYRMVCDMYLPHKNRLKKNNGKIIWLT